MSEIPAVGWVAIVLFSLIAGIGVILKIYNEGKKFGLNFVMSWAFLILVVGFITVFVGGGFDDSAMNRTWCIRIAVGSLGIAGFLNVSKSNFLFGIIYTIAQSIVAVLPVLLVLFLFGASTNKSTARS